MTKVIGLDISVLNDRQRTGIEVYTYELIKALLKQNKKDKFILFGIATFSTFDYLKNIEFKKYSNVELKIYKMPARLFRTAFLIWQKINWCQATTHPVWVGDHHRIHKKGNQYNYLILCK